MVFQGIKKVVMYIPSKLIALNEKVNKVINLPTSADKTFTYVTKVTGATNGAAGAAADGLQICASFIPGPNVTAVVTMPISVGCKVFVWCCKKSKLPWGGC